MPAVAEREGTCVATNVLVEAAIRIDTISTRMKPPHKSRPI
jgi:hypothetical protein